MADELNSGEQQSDFEQNLGANTTLGITYMMSLGRELPTSIDTNFSIAATGFCTFSVAQLTSPTVAHSFAVSTNSEAASSTNYPYATSGGYVTLPHGGATPPPFPNGYQQKFFLDGTRPNWGNHARKKYGKYKICDERFYSYWVPGLIELIFPDWF